MHKVFDYSERKAEWEKFSEESKAEKATRTPEQVEEVRLKTQRGWERLMEKVDALPKYAYSPSKEKRGRFLYFAELLREYASIHGGIIQISIEDHIGRITMTCESIMHISDAIDHSRFMFGRLFLAYENVIILPQGKDICLKLVTELTDQVRVEEEKLKTEPFQARDQIAQGYSVFPL